MFSIVCVFNDAEVLRNRLLNSLESQGEEHEVITVDNVGGRFDRAATALNWGAAQAQGEWLLFAHQDISFLSPDWLNRALGFLKSSATEGWYGSAGLTSTGQLRGIMLDRAMLLGAPFNYPMEVQTLDECLLIHRRKAVGDQYFDEQVPGWHAYGVEACCATIRRGASNYVLPLPIWHDSKSTNLQGLTEAHQYVWQKHGTALGRISTTCGDLPSTYGWPESSRPKGTKKLLERIKNSYYYRLGGQPRALNHDFEELLESLTESEKVVECLHTPAWHDTIEARSFVSCPGTSRKILHRFTGWDFNNFASDCIVVAADLGNTLDGDFTRLTDLRQRVRRLIVCVDWRQDGATRKASRALMQQAQTTQWTRRWDGTARAVLEF